MAHWVTLIFVDIDIYQSEIQVVHPYIVGLSVVGGMSVWDSSLEGAVTDITARPIASTK